MKQKYTDEDLIKQIQNYYKVFNKAPRQPDKGKTEYLACHSPFISHFGSWNKALIAAGIPLNMEVNESIQTYCKYCNKLIKVQHHTYQVSKTKNFFCCKQHAGKYNCNNPKHYTYRSKLEVFVYNKLIKDFPQLKILHNNKSIGFELDLFIPELNLAIEFNGPLHYRPIFGEDFLLKKQKIDILKEKQCENLKIDFHIIDVSHQPYVTPKTCEPFYQYVKELIINKITL